MRDEKDPGTLELALPRKRGRPTLGDEAMTPAQRAQAYRKRRTAARHGQGVESIGDMTDTVLLDSLRAAITSGNREAAGVYARHLAKRYPYR